VKKGENKVCSCQMSLTPKTNLGGGIFHFHCLDAMANLDVPILIPLAFNTDYEKRKKWDVKVFSINRSFRLGALISNTVFLFHLLYLWYFKKERFSLLRISDPYYIGPGALLFAKITRLKTLGYVFHIEDDQPFVNLITKIVCRRLNGVIVTSEFTKGQVVKKYGLDQKNVYVTYGGVTPFDSPLIKEQAKKELELEGKIALSFLGALSRRKNPLGLLEIFSLVAKESREAFLLICGTEVQDTGLLNKLKEKAADLGIEDRVRFTGWIDNDQKSLIYRATDIFVFPSFLEGFGLAVVESMAQGAPAVVSDRGSLPEVVEDGVTGFVIDPDNREKFAKAIVLLVKDQKRRKKMGEKAALTVADKFSWETCGKETIKVHNKILEKSTHRKLGIMLNTGDSLAVMKTEGQQDRFMNKYVANWQKVFHSISIFSYGDDSDIIAGKVKFFPKKNKFKGLIYSILMPFKYKDEIRSLSLIRVMQTQGALPAVIARILYRVPFITTYGYLYGDSMRVKKRYTYGLWLDLLEKIALRFASGVMVTTPSLREKVSRTAGSKKIHYIPNGVDVKLFYPEENKDDSSLKVLFVGRLEEHKNLDLVIESLAPVTFKKVELLVVGEGPLKNKWKNMCKEKKIKATFYGPIPYSEVPGIHRKAHIFVLPSLIEGHPKALIEAFASGLPSLGIDSPGIVDVIEHGRNGLIAKNTISSFAGHLVRLLSDKKLREELGKEARKCAKENFDLDLLLKKEMEVLTSLLKSEGKRG